MFAIFYTLASGEMDMSTASATSATLKASKRNLNLSIDGGGRRGGGLIQPRLFINFFTKKLSSRCTLRPTCKFLILVIFYHAKRRTFDG